MYKIVHWETPRRISRQGTRQKNEACEGKWMIKKQSPARKYSGCALPEHTTLLPCPRSQVNTPALPLLTRDPSQRRAVVLRQASPSHRQAGRRRSLVTATAPRAPNHLRAACRGRESGSGSYRFHGCSGDTACYRIRRVPMRQWRSGRGGSWVSYVQLDG